MHNSVEHNGVGCSIMEMKVSENAKISKNLRQRDCHPLCGCIEL